MSDPTAAQERAWSALRGHRFYAYRGCAPSEDNPALAADETTPADVWLTPDVERQPARLAREAAAKKVCGRCPIVSACLAYALGTVDGGPHESGDLWGGMTATERRHLLKRRRAWLSWQADTTAVDLPAVPRTPQRDAVLVALAAHTDPDKVAAAAGMDVRTANWQRARLVSLYALDPQTTTRAELLDAAHAHGHLPDGIRVVPDGARPVAAIPPQQAHVTPRARTVRPVRARQLTLPGLGPASRYARPTSPPPRPRPRRRLRLVHSARAVEVLTLDTPDTLLEMAA